MTADRIPPLAPTDTLTVTAADGHRFDAALYPSEAPDAPVLLFLPALGTPARVYRAFAAALAQHGLQVCVPDWRGLGSSSLRASRRHNHGYRELVELDAPAVLAALAERCPGAPLWVGGHSLGGQLGTLIAARQPDRVRGLLLLASGSVYLACYPRRLRHGIRLLGALAGITGAAVGYFPGRRLGFGGREARGVMKDWLHVAHTGRYEPAGSGFDYEAALRRLGCPVLALNFEADSWAPAAAARYLLDKLPGCSANAWVWGAGDTGGQALDHFAWTRHPQHVAPRVADWLLRHGSV